MQRILVVEDDPLVGETILCALEEHYQVTLAASVRDAASCLRTEAFDIMLLDCVLPGGGATDLIAQAERRGACVVLTSGDPEQIETQGGGRRPFLAKPFSLDHLLEVLKTACVKHGASLPCPDSLPGAAALSGWIAAPPPANSGLFTPARKSWPAALTGTAWAAATYVAATTLLALTNAPAVATAGPRPD